MSKPCMNQTSKSDTHEHLSRGPPLLLLLRSNVAVRSRSGRAGAASLRAVRRPLLTISVQVTASVRRITGTAIG
jgi:hypothetical protein